MTDVFSKEKRSRIMSQIRSKSTKPEMVVRRALYSMGFRYRLHISELPGCPDIVLSKNKKAIFVHGCFWHGHDICKRSKRPETNTEFWNKKLENNIKRDGEIMEELKSLGWDVLVIWQCQTKNTSELNLKLKNFLSEDAI